MKKKYLPSDLFITRAVTIAVIILVLFGLYKAIPALYKGFSNTKKKVALQNVKVKDVIGKDSNNNGIADWEETLWGLDPTKNGSSNKEFIVAKKGELGQNDGIPDDQNISSSDVMARELLATIISLENSNSLDDNSIAQISKAVGQKVAIQSMPDIYSNDIISTSDTNSSSILNYYNAFKKLTIKYQGKDMGNELTFVSQGIKNNDPQALKMAGEIASAYRDFGKELTIVKVPTSLVEIDLSLANNYERVAKSIEQMNLSLTDQISGMNGVLSYKKYSDDLFANLQNLQTFFEKNGIITSS